jgi:L-alanine-DL-glutamate epimerase-like enolase superfamily enzyme
VSKLKIKDLKAYCVEMPFKEPGLRVAHENPEKIIKSERFTLVKIFTDEGITGFGVQDVPDQWFCEYIERQVKPYLINQVVEPFYIEKFVRYFRPQPFGTKVSPRPCCVEIALWDCIGKKAGLPIYKLLGAYQDKVKAYASVLEEYPLWNAEKWVKFVDRLFKEGFKAVKLHIGWMWPDPNKVINIVKKIRENVGYNVDLMVDAMQAWVPQPLYDFQTALKYARGLEKYEVSWLEEPLPHFNNPELSAKLCDAVDIPIAGGGAMFGFHTFKTVLEKGALDIVQPDVMHAGGILEVRRIAFLAEAYGKQCIPHFWGPGIGLAATLQVIGSTNIPWVEYCYHPPAFDVEVRDAMLSEPIKIDEEGFIEIPKKPGLGVELNEDFIKKHIVT